MSLITIAYIFASGNTIIASQHNTNNSTIYNDYNGNITDANISAGAAIQNSKLNLSTISQNIALLGSLTTNGAIIANGSLTTAGNVIIGSEHQGDIFYDNGTTLSRLTPGTNGQYLQTQGASANPQWASIPTSNFVLISTTNVSSTTSSGNISITVGNRYFVQLVGFDTSAGSNTPGIRFNADSGAHYSSGYSGRGASNVIGASSAGGTSIFPSTAIVASESFQMTFYISPNNGSEGGVQVWGTLSGQLVTGGSGTVSTFGGFWANATVTNFSIMNTGNWTGTVYLYQIN